MSQAAASAPTVLVVDDDRPLADLYSDWLAERYDVHTAYGGEAALACIDDLGTDLDAILLDRQMPEVTGDLLLVILRDRGYDCPVAMVTAIEPAVDVLDLGFDDYLTKPATEAELVATVESLLDLDSFHSVARELSALRVKRNVLELERSPDTLERSDRFRRLGDRIETLESRIRRLGRGRAGSASATD